VKTRRGRSEGAGPGVGSDGAALAQWQALERRRLRGATLGVGLGLLCVAAYLGVALWYAPMLGNPWQVWLQLATDAIDPELLRLQAAILPLMTLACALLLLVLVLLTWRCVHIRRRWLRLASSQIRNLGEGVVE